MRTHVLRSRSLACATFAAVVAVAVPAIASAQPTERVGAPSRHVLLLSVDGMHQADLDWYVRNHPSSALAALARRGTDYTNAQTTMPSDSFPGMVAQLTGGNPKTTGVYYDDTFNHDLMPAGTTDCAHAKPGAEVNYTEGLDKDPSSLDAGQGLAGLPGSILSMTGNPTSLIDPATLPVDPTSCKPVFPNQYLKVNTVFDVVAAHGRRTAWSDKHPAYQILNGPNPHAISDAFTPEINSTAIGYPAGDDWTRDNAATQQYDGYKVRAVLNEIDGFDHSGRTSVGEPAVFGMNFQSVSTAQKLPTSNGMTGGYLPGGTVPGPLLSRALDFVNSSVGSMLSELGARGHARDTAIILSAKHGQSPTDPATLTRVPDGPIIDGVNAAWAAAHPGAGPLVIFSTDDDVLQFWLSDRSQSATDFVRNYLLSHPASGNDINGAPKAVQASGLSSVAAGSAAARLFGVSVTDPRHADVFGIVQHGVVYTGGKGKIAEHGGADPQDRHVPILVVTPDAEGGARNGAAVETTQIAPTILALLGLNPRELQAVRTEGTPALPVP